MYPNGYNLFFVIFLSLADHDVYSDMNLLLQSDVPRTEL